MIWHDFYQSGISAGLFLSFFPICCLACKGKLLLSLFLFFWFLCVQCTYFTFGNDPIDIYPVIKMSD